MTEKDFEEIMKMIKVICSLGDCAKCKDAGLAGNCNKVTYAIRLYEAGYKQQKEVAK